MSTATAAALRRAQEIFSERPAAARKANAFANATWIQDLMCEVTGPGSELAITDMPPPMGGQGKGCNPGWLMRASLASCAATAILMRAALRGITLEVLQVLVESESDARGLVGIDGVSMALENLRMSIRISAKNVDPATLRELATTVATMSPVNATLCASPAMSLNVTVE